VKARCMGVVTRRVTGPAAVGVQLPQELVVPGL
jgi:hypothetical protein